MKIQRAQVSNDFTGTLDELIDRKATARLLHASMRTLDRWHVRGIGPPRIQVNRKVFYRRRSIERWLCSREVVGPRSA